MTERTRPHSSGARARTDAECDVDALLAEISGVVNPDVIGQRMADRVAADLRLPVTMFALAEPDEPYGGCFAMRGRSVPGPGSSRRSACGRRRGWAGARSVT